MEIIQEHKKQELGRYKNYIPHSALKQTSNTRFFL